MIRRIVALVLIAATLLAVLLLLQRRPEALRVSGFVEAHEIRLGSRVGGRVQQVLVEEGQRVEQDQVLIKLEPYDLLHQYERAQAMVAEQQAQLEELQAGYRPEEIAQAQARRDQLAARLDKLRAGARKQEIAAAEAELDLAQAQLVLAQQNHQRTLRLYEMDVTTQEEMDDANNQLRVAEARVQTFVEQVALLREGTREEEIREAEAQLHEAEQAWLLQKHGYRSEQISQARAAVDAAKAAASAMEQQLEELTIKAPISGVVQAIELRPGDLVSANAPSIAIMDLSDLWVRAYVPEDELDIELGQSVPVSVDSFPGKTFRGEITFIARQAEFTPGNVQTPEDRSQQVFRIRVELREGADQLRPGMAADVWLDGPGAVP